MWKFGIQKRRLTAVVEQARKAVETLREELCAARVDNGFSTSYSVSDPQGNYAATITGGNGVALFSASQTREDGGTNNNNIVKIIATSIFKRIVEKLALNNLESLTALA